LSIPLLVLLLVPIPTTLWFSVPSVSAGILVPLFLLGLNRGRIRWIETHDVPPFLFVGIKRDFPLLAGGFFSHRGFCGTCFFFFVVHLCLVVATLIVDWQDARNCPKENQPSSRSKS